MVIRNRRCWRYMAMAMAGVGMVQLRGVRGSTCYAQ